MLVKSFNLLLLHNKSHSFQATSLGRILLLKETILTMKMNGFYWLISTKLFVYIFNSHTNIYFKYYSIAQEGQIDCVMWLTKYSNTSASEPTNDGMTAVHASAQEGHLDCVRYLIQFARCPAVLTDHSGCTPLHFGEYLSTESHVHTLLEFPGG